MSGQDDKFQRELLSVFRIEAQEHLHAITSGLLKLEKDPSADAHVLIEMVFREAHSLKGAARTVDLSDVGNLCQGMESVFSALLKGKLSPSPELFDVLHQALAEVDGLLTGAGGPAASLLTVLGRLEALEQGQGQAVAGLSPAASSVPASELIPAAPQVHSQPPSEASSGRLATPPATTSSDRGSGLETVRVSSKKLDDLLLQAEELLGVKPILNQRVADLMEVLAVVELWRKRWRRVRPEMRHMKSVLGKERATGLAGVEQESIEKLVEFADECGAFLQQIENSIAALGGAAEADHRGLAAKVDHHLEEMKKAVMLPASSLLDGFPRMVRDLCREHGKEATLVVRGGEVEMDRRVLEGLKDPLIHLVRNAIDHGIEPSADRDAMGKPREARLSISFAPREGNRVEISVADDGLGIDHQKVMAAAARQGIDGAADERSALSLIFRSEVSTSPVVTDLSGRGLGLAIVQEKVDRLGGQVSVETRQRQGTTFRLLLPLTMATFRGVLVQAGGRLFVVPTSAVQRAVRVKPEAIRSAGNQQLICVEGRNIPYVRLEALLEIPEKGSGEERRIHPVLVIKSQGRRLAVGVDEIQREEEVLVKGLGRQLLRVRNVAGATVLGSGQVAPILNVRDLVKSAGRGIGPSTSRPAGKQEDTRERSILVVEDSITSRMLLKNLLESAGYQVRTAVDGADAWAVLRGETFDLVVSDVQMPKMDGFDLTRKIRGEKTMADLPVVLVTSLASQEDRVRGVDAGASAYIVKSSFDQDSLLSVIRRLL